MEKYWSLSVLSERNLHNNANRNMATFVHFKSFYGHEVDILAYILSHKFQRTCNLMVQIERCWFHSKILIFDQAMATNGPHAHIWVGIRFLDNWTEIFWGSSGDHNLSISDEKSKLRCLFLIIRSLSAGKWAWPPCTPQMVWGLQTRPTSTSWPIGRTFGPTAISKSCFRNFQGRIPLNTITINSFPSILLWPIIVSNLSPISHKIKAFFE